MGGALEIFNLACKFQSRSEILRKFCQSLGPQGLFLRNAREASTHILEIRSCIARTDLKNKAFSADFVPFSKIRSYSARSDLKSKSARFSGKLKMQLFVEHGKP